MEGLARRLSTGAPSIPTGVMDMAANLNLNLLQKATSQVQRCTSLVIFPSSTKTIPFTVPAAAGSPSQRGPRFDDAGSGGSEPASPSGGPRGSLESLATPSGSLEFRGAYSVGSIDPSLYNHNDADDNYDIPDHHIGRVWFAVEYERETEKLLVTLMKAKNLPSRSMGSINQCDPFVRIFLMPDERRYLQSKFKKKTCNPKFEESFVFQVSNKAIDERVLRLTLYDVDRHRRHQVIGHALYSLKEHNYDSNERVVMWRDLEREISETTNDKGEINVSLCYNNHLERLTIGVFEGKNFLKAEGATLPDYCMKVCLMHQSKVVKTKRTEVAKRSTNPVFNESFTFKLPVSSLDMSSVSVTAMQHSSGSRGAYSVGSIDPSLYNHNDADDNYDIPDHHIGRVWFAVEYERETEKLLVTLMKAKNLPSRSMGSINQCDPFVRIFLMPDERRYLQSKFKKKTCNPKFEESFVFQVSNKAIDERVLRLTLYDVDRHRRHQVIGHALYSLKEHNYDSNERVVMWRDLEREISETTNDKGEINVSLCYNNHLERLTIGVFEGKNFLKAEGATLPDYCMKVCLMHQSKVVKTKRTEVAKRSTNPVFNESFTFKLPVSSLDMSSVSVTAMQHSSGSRDKGVGRIVFGSFMFSRGKELEHWNEMLANQKEQVAHWQTLT